MNLCTEMIFADPVLQRVFFDARRFAPMMNRDAIVAIAEFAISERKVKLQKATRFEDADKLRREIRRQYVIIRRHSDGYLVDFPGGFNDGCEHVVGFAPDARERLRPDRAQLAHLQHRFDHRARRPGLGGRIAARHRAAVDATG